MSFRGRFFVCNFVFLLTSFACRSDVPNQEKYEAVFSDTVSKINDGLKARHITNLVLDPKRGLVTSEADELRRQNIVEVSFNPQINIEILPDSFEVISFYRDVSSAGFTFYKVAPKPTWTPSRAVKEARDWYESVVGTFPKNVGEPVTEFTPGLDPPKYYDGQWSVRWPRIDSEGHQFYQDAISTTLSEKYGITSVANNFVSKYADGQKTVVSKDQAVEVGRVAAQKLLDGPLAADWSAGLRLQSAATAELWIVNPNHILNYKSFDAMMAANEGSLHARLAWVVEYRAENAQGMGRYVDVWVDTETKEILGGDFRN